MRLICHRGLEQYLDEWLGADVGFPTLKANVNVGEIQTGMVNAFHEKKCCYIKYENSTFYGRNGFWYLENANRFHFTEKINILFF